MILTFKFCGTICGVHNTDEEWSVVSEMVDVVKVRCIVLGFFAASSSLFCKVENVHEI